MRNAIFLPLFLFAAGCPDSCRPPVDAGPQSGDGILIQDGEEIPYAVDFDESELVVLVKKNTSAGCALLHSHAIAAESYAMDFIVNLDEPGKTTFMVNVPVNGLEPDSPESREVFAETRGLELSEGDRSAIRASVEEYLQGEEHPEMVFEIKSVDSESTEPSSPSGSANMAATISGLTSQSAFPFTSAFDGENFIIEGSASIDGDAHEIPPAGAFGAACVNKDLVVHLKLVLVPGEAVEPPDVLDAGPYEETVFPYDGGCLDDIGFDDVQPILMRSCGGCHLAPPALGATVPLLEFDDFRVDSKRNPGQPLYETAVELMQLDLAESRHMPPSNLKQLTADELETVLDWEAAGGPSEKCTPDSLPTFTSTPPIACGPTTGYAEDIDPLIQQYCTACHTSSQEAIAAFDFDGWGTGETSHAFYRPLNLFESSYERILDESMPPSSTLEAADLLIFTQWVAEGYPLVRCD